MSKYIDADAFALEIGDWQRHYDPKGDLEDRNSFASLDIIISMLENFPSSDVRENVRGEWLYLTGSKGTYGTIHCKNCGMTCNAVPTWQYNFCPNCGADMRGE